MEPFLLQTKESQIQAEHLEFIKELLSVNSNKFLKSKDIEKALLKFDLSLKSLSRSTVAKAIKEVGFSYRKTHPHPVGYFEEKNLVNHRRVAFDLQERNFANHKILYVDEIGTNISLRTTQAWLQN